MSKVKYSSAEAKRTAERLALEWEQIKNKQYQSKSMYIPSNSTASSAASSADIKKPAKKKFNLYDVSPNMGTSRVTSADLPSRVTAGGSTAPKTPQMYTGEKMIGITVLHKSCLQPVFSQQAAVDAASMRR